MITKTYISWELLLWFISTISPGVLGDTDLCFGSLNVMEFNTDTHFCCDGKVFQRLSEHFQEQACCGNATYNFDKYLCCGDRIVNKILPNGQRHECCGTHVYQPSPSTLCCGNEERRLYTKAGLHESCCGMQLYNRKLSECCWDDHGNITLHTKQKDHECCGAMYYNTSAHDCVSENTIMPKGKRVCGSKQYDMKEKFCCIDKLYDSPWNPKQSCCGNRRYDITTHKCCWSDNPHVIPANSLCCGNGFYNPKSQRCCLDNVVNISSPHFECCGPNLYNTLNESCCMPGHTVYDKTINRCCKGSITDIHRECCGSTSYDQRQQVCCNKEFTIHKHSHSDDKCCYSRYKKLGKPYDSSKQRCITRHGDTHIEKRVPLCGWEVFNKTSDLCCNMVLIPGGQLKNLRCCSPGKLPFDPKTQICCNSAVYNKSERKSCYDFGYRQNLEQKRICNICNLREHKRQAKSTVANISNICKRNVIHFIVKKQQKRKHRVKLIGRIKDNESDRLRRRSRILVLPCTCIIKSTNILVLSNKSTTKRHIRLDHTDYVVPYLKKTELKLRRKCTAT